MRLGALLVILTGVGCAVGEGDGALSGTLFLQQCTSDSGIGSLGAPATYNMEPGYFAATPIDDFMQPMPMHRLTIRVQPGGNRIEETDALVITIGSVGLTAAELGSPITVGAATNLRAALVLNRTCPKAEVQLELDGTITFSQMGTAQTGVAPPSSFTVNFGDRLAATLSTDIVDRRFIALGGFGATGNQPAAGGHLDGSFDFIVRQGRQSQ